MWLTKKFVMEDFAAEVKKGKYKKIDYQTWRELKELPDEWDLDIVYNLNNYSEKDSRYVTISWDGCNWPYEFYIEDDSLGEYIYNLIKLYNIPTNTCTISNSFAKCAEAANKAASSWSTSLSNTWRGLQQLTVSDNSDVVKPPALEVTEDGITIGGKTIEQLMDEATGASMTTRKENDNMDLIKNFDFGSCKNDNVKVSMYGIAVKNAAGTWVSYDSKTGNIIDVDILNFDGKYLYKMPVAIKDVAVGDTVIHNRKPVFVTKVEGGKILAIDPAAGEEKVIILTKNMFGFDFVTKVVNLFSGFMNGATADSPFGNMLPLMLMSEGKTDDMLPLMFLMNGGKMDMSNPMMLYFLMKDKGGNDMLPFLMMSNFNSAGKCNCDCDCDREG